MNANATAPIAYGSANWRMVSQTGEYALRAVLHIARRREAVPVPVPDIARALHVPAKYLARVLNVLAHSGVLHSTRGTRGGFALARPAAGLALADVLAPFEPADEAPRCLLRGEQCGAGRQCAAHATWHDLAAGVRAFFERTSVADLLSGHVPAPTSYAGVQDLTEE